jgi:hypothetical protein
MGEGNSPGKAGWLAVAAAGKKTADSPYGLTKGKSRGQDIAGFEKRESSFFKVDEAGGECKKKTAVKNQAPAPDHKHLKRVPQVVARVEEYIKDAGANDSSDEQIEN